MIWFNVEEAFSYLMEKGEVFTIRCYRKKDGPMIGFSMVPGYKFHFKVHVQEVARIDLSDPSYLPFLEHYVSMSGFKSVERWLAKVQLKDGKSPYLYHARLLK